ncbi:MAG: zf-HC2 domain-containing protein [Allgaiera sp.]|jgi:anti-sigma factor ChrR (cupin superfamily)|nr:zf-HC2 domain-containing protein [Allgaiera sp.]
MLRCDHVAEEASALIDGNLSWWHAQRLRMHLLMCKSCDRFVRQIRITKSLTEAVDDSTAPSDVTIDQILARARKRE